MILDDDREIRETLTFMAEDLHFEVTATSTYEELMAALNTRKPTHIVVDLVMPEVDGTEVLKSLAKEDCDAGIIILSGVDDRVLEAARKLALERGLKVLGVLTKPFRLADFRALLNLEKPAATRHDNRKDSVVSFAGIRGALQEAILNDDIRVEFQPKITCSSGWVVGFEALARWDHSIYGNIPPEQFIALAERHNLIVDITRLIFEKSLLWLHAKYPRSAMTLAINVSVTAMDKFDWGEHALRLCKAHDIDPRRLIFELTETAATTQPVEHLSLLTRARLKGFELAIDDFGAGYSSIAQLARIPFSEIKIDKPFVGSALASEESRAIIKFIIGIARALKLRVTAEGVEDRETLMLMDKLGCDSAQGFYISKALPGDQISEWVEQWQAAQRAERAVARSS